MTDDSDRTTPDPRPRRRRNSSLRVVVEETRMLFGALSRVIEKMARSMALLRQHEHKQNNTLTVMNLKLDLLLRHHNIELPEMPDPELMEETPPDGTDTRR